MNIEDRFAIWPQKSISFFLVALALIACAFSGIREVAAWREGSARCAHGGYSDGGGGLMVTCVGGGMGGGWWLINQ